MTCKTILASTLVLSTAIFASDALAADYATKAEFVAAVAGKTMSTTTKKGKSFVAKYAANGGGTFSAAGADPAKFTWTFKGDTLCTTFKSMKFTECNHVQIVSAGSVKFIDAKTGKLNNNYSVR